jgi:tight adherence protein B
MMQYILLGLLTLGIGAVVYVLGSAIFIRKDEGLDTYLGSYLGDGGEPQAGSEGTGLSSNAMMRAAVERTERFAADRGFLEQLSSDLRKAQVPLSAPESLMAWLGGGLAAVIVVALLTQNIVFIGVTGLLAALLPPFIIRHKIKKRAKRFGTELPDMLMLLGSTLRAGYSLMQGFEAVAKEVDGPVGDELDQFLAETRLGRPMGEALEASANRVQLDDWTWTVMAIEIQREVGGNLAELLNTVADTMIARDRLRRDVFSLTAEGRVSAYMLGGLPIVLGLVMYAMNPEYISLLFQRTIGLIALGGAAVLMLAGFLWMAKIIDIEV